MEGRLTCPVLLREVPETACTLAYWGWSPEYLRESKGTYVHVYSRMHIQHAYTHMHICTHMLCTYMHAYMYTCTHACIHADRVCINVYTHTQTCIRILEGGRGGGREQRKGMREREQERRERRTDERGGREGGKEVGREKIKGRE